MDTLFLALNSTRWNNIPNIMTMQSPPRRSQKILVRTKLISSLDIHKAQARPCMVTTRAQWSAYAAQLGLNSDAGLPQVNDSKGETWKMTPAPVPQKTARTKLMKMFTVGRYKYYPGSRRHPILTAHADERVPDNIQQRNEARKQQETQSVLELHRRVIGIWITALVQ